MRHYTEEQLKALKEFEPYFKTAVNSDWARHPGQAALTTIHKIFTEATKSTRKLNGSCQSCILHLLQDAGHLYFADVKAREEIQTTQDLEIKKIPVKVKRTKKNAV